MSKWRVYNMNSGYTHSENFKGDLITIPYGEYVTMDYEDAIQFKGQYFPMKIKATGDHDPAGFKILKLVQDSDDGTTAVTNKFISHMDGKEFHSKAELDAYVSQNFSEQVFKDEALDEEIAKEAIVAEKRKPGRPPKEKTL